MGNNKKTVDFYLSKGFDRPMAEYFANGRRTITAVEACDDFTLLLRFDNGEYRRYDCKPLLKVGTVFEPFISYGNFKRVYLDSDNSVCWDANPDVDSNVVWSNKVDLSTDVCYVDSVPVSID